MLYTVFSNLQRIGKNAFFIFSGDFAKRKNTSMSFSSFQDSKCLFSLAVLEPGEAGPQHQQVFFFKLIKIISCLKNSFAVKLRSSAVQLSAPAAVRIKSTVFFKQTEERQHFLLQKKG